MDSSTFHSVGDHSPVASTQGQTLQGAATPHAFCDYLDVTYPADSPVWSEVSDVLSRAQASFRNLVPSGIECRFFEVYGVLRVSSGANWLRISASGGVCSHLRDIGLFEAYLHALGSSPHRVTRLDASLDVAVDGSQVIKGLMGRYGPDDPVYLTRKGIRAKPLLTPRASDGALTGTFYVGHRSKARVTARVYDKAQERLDNAGLVIPPLTRYEVTLRKDVGVTLRDAFDPTAAFWHFASPALLQAPPGVPGWSPSEIGWESSPVKRDPFEKLASRVNRSSELDQLIELADACGEGGRLDLLRLLRSRLQLFDVAIPSQVSA